jgi:hypothetical protein
MRGWAITALAAVAALWAVAGCEVVFPLSGPDPVLDGSVADGPAASADAVPGAPDATIDALVPPPPPDSHDSCQAPDLACLGTVGNGVVSCVPNPFNYCPTLAGVFDALDPYDVCTCSSEFLPYLYVLENGDATATVVLISVGIDDAGLLVNMDAICRHDDVGCDVSTPECGTVELVAWYGVPISAGTNQLEVQSPNCNVPMYTFYYP